MSNVSKKVNAWNSKAYKQFKEETQGYDDLDDQLAKEVKRYMNALKKRLREIHKEEETIWRTMRYEMQGDMVKQLNAKQKSPDAYNYTYNIKANFDYYRPGLERLHTEYWTLFQQKSELENIQAVTSEFEVVSKMYNYICSHRLI